MIFKKLTEEMKFTVVIVVAVLMVPVVFYLLNLFTDVTAPPAKPREMTVIVTEAEKKQILAKLPPQEVIKSVREAIKQGNNSTAYMQLGKPLKDSAESEELRKLLEKEAKSQKRPGIRKVAENPQNPVKYLDETSPRDRSTDALYIYLVDIYGTVWPRICIQSAGKKAIGITSFSINADGKTFTIQPTMVKTEKFEDKVSEYFDALLDKQSYSALQAVLRSRKASLTCIGAKGEVKREISEQERKGLSRILDTYAALGGNFAFLQSAAPLPNPTARHPKATAKQH